jgi:LPS-assembly protein
MKTAGLVALWGLVAAAAAAGPAGPVLAEPNPGDIYIASDQEEAAGDILTATGHVRIAFRDIVLEADRVEINQKTKDAVATGNVVLQEGDRRITGERIEFNLETRLGKLWAAWGYADPEIIFEAKEVEKTGEDRYDLKSARVTSCNQPRPQWQLAASSGTYYTGHYVRLVNARLEVFGVPVLYLPYFQYPAKRDRSTGLLFPAIGSNNVYGFYVGESFFWAINRSADATVSYEWYKNRGSAVMSEVLYTPSKNITGAFSSENRFDTLEDRTRSAYRFSHNQRIGRTFRVGADIHYASDERIDQDYSQSISRISSRTRNSSVFVARNWSRYSLLASAAEQVFLSGSERTDRRLPVVQFGVRDTPLLGPLTGSLRTSGSRFSQKFSAPDFFTWERLDFDPVVSMPLNPFPWLKVSPGVEYHLTYYTKSYAPGSDRQDVLDEGYLRRYAAYWVQLVGPIFGKVFHTPDNFYAEKYKHVIEPSVSYTYTQDIDPDGQSIQIDGIDRIYPVNQLSFDLRNRLLAKREVIAGGKAVPYEFLTFGLSLAYSLDRALGTYLDGRNTQSVVPAFDGSRRGPLVGSLRFVPVQRFSAAYRFYFDTDATVFTSQSLGGSFHGDGWSTDVTYTRGRSVDQVTQNALRGSVSTVLGRRLELWGSVSYDVLNENLQQLGSSAVYKTQCCGFGVGYSRFNLGSRNDNQLNFSVSLKNIGTVFDYKLGDQRL